MHKEVDIVFLEEAEHYFGDLPKKVKDKFTYNFTKTLSGYKGEWFEKLKSTSGLFEFRVRDEVKFYRIFAFWDSTGTQKTLIVATHGFDKKSNKTPSKEISKAERIKKKYFNSKSRK